MALDDRAGMGRVLTVVGSPDGAVVDGTECVGVEEELLAD